MCVPKLFLQFNDKQPVLFLHVVPVKLLQEIDRLARQLADKLVILVELPTHLELILCEGSRRNPNRYLLPSLGRIHWFALKFNGTNASKRKELYTTTAASVSPSNQAASHDHIGLHYN